MGEKDTVNCPESWKFSGNTQFFHLVAIEWNIIDTRPSVPMNISPDIFLRIV